jgi:uridine kinase
LLVQLAHRTEPVQLELPIYDKIKNQQISAAEKFLLVKKDVVIVEGAIALTLQHLIHKNIVHSWYIETDEDLRHQRCLSAHRLRGGQVHEKGRIYQQRQNDESRFIVGTAKFATKRLRIDLGDSYC